MSSEVAMDAHIKTKYALFSFFVSILLGGSFVYLFCWKTVGISHMIFYLICLLSAIIPVFVIEGEKGLAKLSKSALLMPVIFLLSTVFIYRLNSLWMFLAFVSIFVVYSLFFASLFNSDTLSNFGIWSFLSFPFKMFIAWLGDMVEFLKNIKFTSIRSPRVRSILGRVLKGCIIALPFVLFFLITLSLADENFASMVGDIWKNTLGGLFKDLETLLQLLLKLFVGGMMSIYYMVFLFSLWNKESILHRFMNKNATNKYLAMNRSWDVLTSSVFLAAINVIFIAFVVIQFVYLFGGKANIDNYTYASYARKGFMELVVTGSLVYLIILIVSQKVNIVTIPQKVMYKTNFIVMILCSLVMNISAWSRLLLYQSTYGYTTLRLFVDLMLAIMFVMFVILLVNELLKGQLKIISISTAILVFASYLLLLFVPSDYVVARLNYSRYVQEGKIDLPYMIRLSNEALPVYFMMLEDNRVSELSRNILISELEERYNEMEEDRKDWQSFNLMYDIWKSRIEQVLETNSSRKDAAAWDLQEFLYGYSEAIKSGNYSEAYEKYWSKNTVPLDWSRLRDMTITKYSVQEVPDYNQWSLDDNYGYQYGSLSGIYIIVDMTYRYKSSAGAVKTESAVDTLYVIIEDGQWKIKYSVPLTLANFKDEGGYTPAYYQNTDFDYLFYR